jgi:hypothetical protein
LVSTFERRRILVVNVALATMRTLSKGLSMQPLHTVQRIPRRRSVAIGAAALTSVAVVGLAGSPAGAATPKPLPTPTNIVVSKLTAQSFTLNIGGATPKLYSVFLNGRLTIGVAQSSSTISFPVNGLTQNTDYSVTVQEIVLPSGRTSALSAPRLVRTPAYVAPARPNAPTNLRASAETSESANLSWTASTTPGVSYRVYVNGEARDIVSGTTATIAPSGFPNPIPGSGLRPGRANRIAVEAVTTAGVASVLAEITVNTPGAAANAPTAPTGLRVTSVSNNQINLTWNPSTDSQTTEQQLQYRFVIDGRLGAYTCSQYCFGTTGGGVAQLTPGTTYRIGVVAINATGGVSDIAEITATTAAP